jgi:hypothetical protein
MSSSRPKLTVDEHSFQDMLAAAFTIQEHNAQRKKGPPPVELVCEQCGSPLPDHGAPCQNCAEQPRPGEQLQRKWASLWLMSQEQGLWPERPSPEPTDAFTSAPPETRTPGNPALDFGESLAIPAPEEGAADPLGAAIEAPWSPSARGDFALDSSPTELTGMIESAAKDNVDEAVEPSYSLRDLRLRLRFHRADFYLVMAVVVSTFAMVWVLSATPAPGAHHKPQLRLWERALISFGLAEAPEPPPQSGNPGISVWVDPKTALYYCAGEDLYGKAPGGHLATQREAQLDQFEPAGRAPCE